MRTLPCDNQEATERSWVRGLWLCMDGSEPGSHYHTVSAKTGCTSTYMLYTWTVRGRIRWQHSISNALKGYTIYSVMQFFYSCIFIFFFMNTYNPYWPICYCIFKWGFDFVEIFSHAKISGLSHRKSDLALSLTPGLQTQRCKWHRDCRLSDVIETGGVRLIAWCEWHNEVNIL